MTVQNIYIVIPYITYGIKKSLYSISINTPYIFNFLVLYDLSIILFRVKQTTSLDIFSRYLERAR